ncbi:MAG: hypothetical protein EXR75_07305 [Myxococcales bacterium]|nr:hypothetical protein [Myxococcales bacterium]
MPTSPGPSSFAAALASLVVIAGALAAGARSPVPSSDVAAHAAAVHDALDTPAPSAIRAPEQAPQSASAAPIEERGIDDAHAAEPTILGCAIEERGNGDNRVIDMEHGTLLMPNAPSPAYDLVLHFHGGEPARKLLAPANLGVVVRTVDLGAGSERYARALGMPRELHVILDAVERELAPSRRRHLVVTAWSAGYGAVRALLTHNPEIASAFVLLDSVHTSYQPDGHTLEPMGLLPFEELAQRAAHGRPYVLVTHSSIRPPGYASTTEVADALTAHVGARRRYGGLAHAAGLEQLTRVDSGAFHVRGYTGIGKDAHCAQLRLLPEILRDDVLPFLAAPR